jgi:sulfate permease, SulP family
MAAKNTHISFWPFISWLPNLRNNLRADFLAGLTVALLLIPQSMAYAELAGMPAYYGLYAAFIPVMIGALWGSLHQLGTGPVAMTSILTASILVPFAAQGTEKYVQCAILLALIVGIIRLLLGCFKLAFLVKFISHPVVSSFTNAGALIICLSQFNKLFGLPKENSVHLLGFMQDIVNMFAQVGETHLPSLAFGVGTMVIMYLCRKWVPQIPGMLVAVIVSILISKFIDFSAMGGVVVGDIPRGLPTLGIMAWNWQGAENTSVFVFAVKMIPGAAMVVLIGFMEVLAVSKAISLKTKQPLNLNQELIGQGISSIAGSFAQSYPTSGSFSRTALNLHSGARSGMSSVFTGIVVLIVLLFFTPLLQALPKATLAAGIIMSVVGLMDIKPIKRAFKVCPRDGYIALFTFIITLVFAPNIVNGVIAGVILSIILYIPKMCKKSGFSQIAIKTDDEVKFKLSGHLYFVNYDSFESALLETLDKNPNIKKITVDSSGVISIDAGCEWDLCQLHTHLHESGVELVFTKKLTTN